MDTSSAMSKRANGASMKVSSERSQKIKNMSLLCAVLVVSIHIDWPYEHALSVGWWMYHLFAQGVSRIAVPYFFVVSGFFLAAHFDEEKWHRREIMKRIKTLLVPFLFWCAVAVIASVPLSIIADILAHRPFGTSIYFMHDMNWFRCAGLDFTDFPIHVPLWYVRCLFLLLLTAPVFKYGIDRFGYAWLAATFSLNLLCNHIPNESVYHFFSRGFSLSGVFYFSIGVFLQRFPVKSGGRKCIVLCGLVGIGLLALKLVFVYHVWRFETCIGKLSLPFLMFSAWGVMTAFKLPQWLTSCSFPIFLMHTITIPYIGVAMKRIPIGPTIAAFVAFGSSIAISIAAAVILRRFFPRFANVIFGGR